MPAKLDLDDSHEPESSTLFSDKTTGLFPFFFLVLFLPRKANGHWAKDSGMVVGAWRVGEA